MHIVPINQIPEKLEEVPTNNLKKIYKICKQMENVCLLENGIGLSAVQVGIPWNLFVVRFDKDSTFGLPNEFGYFINCEYKDFTEEAGCAENITDSLEGCLSIRSEKGQLRLFQVNRYKKIIISGLKLEVGLQNNLKLVDFNECVDIENQGVVYQHEIDHAFGILISDIGKEINWEDIKNGINR